MSKSKLTQCKACGAEIAKSAKTCPQCGAKNKKHKALGIVLAVLGFFIIIGAATGGSAEEPEKVGETPPAAVEQEKAPTAPAKVEATTPAPTEPEKKVFTVGDVVELGNVVVTLVDVKQSNGGFMTPSDGNTFVICEFKIENNSTSDIAVSSMMSFSAYVDDYSASYSLGAITSTDKGQLDGTVAAGKKMAGVVGYEIPRDWKELEIRYTPDYWNGEEIVFVANNK